MFSDVKKVAELADIKAHELPEKIRRLREPVVLRGFASDWPVVKAALQSDEELVAYIKRFYVDKIVVCYSGKPENRGHFFYNDDCRSFNYESKYTQLSQVLDQLLAAKQEENPASFYVGSTTVDVCLPGFRAENDIGSQAENALVSIWIGNRANVAAHFDAPDNLACCVAGRRRFCVLPIEQVKNLYIGPLEFTPSGQPISMVDFNNPDLEKFPRFREALHYMQIAELEPGDALYLPSMWWHQVSSQEDINVLVNYWWRDVPRYIDAPINALLYSILSIRDLEPHEKAAWKVLFDHYVFEDQQGKHDHIPEAGRGFLNPMTEPLAKKLRTWLLNKLNR